MKNYLTVPFILVFAVMFTACTSEMRDNLNELSSNSSDKAVETKNEFLSQVSEELERVEVILNEIENEAKKTSEEFDDTTRENLEQLKKQRAKLEGQIGALKNVSKENWEMTKESFSESMDEFKTEFNSFVEGLKIG